MTPKTIDVDSISPERKRIAKIFKRHIESAIDELGFGYNVSLQGIFDATPFVLK